MLEWIDAHPIETWLMICLVACAIWMRWTIKRGDWDE